MPYRTPLDWEDLERELHAAGVPPRKSRRAHASCSARRAGTSSPKPASSWA
jgi:hypothetical protein